MVGEAWRFAVVDRSLRGQGFASLLDLSSGDGARESFVARVERARESIVQNALRMSFSRLSAERFGQPAGRWRPVSARQAGLLRSDRDSGSRENGRSAGAHR